MLNLVVHGDGDVAQPHARWTAVDHALDERTVQLAAKLAGADQLQSPDVLQAVRSVPTAPQDEQGDEAKGYQVGAQTIAAHGQMPEGLAESMAVELGAAEPVAEGLQWIPATGYRQRFYGRDA